MNVYIYSSKIFIWKSIVFSRLSYDNYKFKYSKFRYRFKDRVLNNDMSLYEISQIIHADFDPEDVHGGFSIVLAQIASASDCRW